MLPNPTIIDSVPYKDWVGEGKTIVFTAFLLEEKSSKQCLDESMNSTKSNATDECWYPTIYFYDLEKN